VEGTCNINRHTCPKLVYRIRVIRSESGSRKLIRNKNIMCSAGGNGEAITIKMQLSDKFQLFLLLFRIITHLLTHSSA
jgi:hypothetical protein